MSAHAQKFHVQHLDCAACAAKIERALQRTEGVEEAVVDFASLTLHLKAADIPKAMAAVARIDPQVILTTVDPGKDTPEKDAGDPGRLRRQLAAIAAAGILFMVLLLFEDRLHALPWAWMEYAVAAVAYLVAGWSVLAGAFNTVRCGRFFDENVLMVIATAGAMAIHALSEAVGVMLFFKIGEMLQDMAVERSRRSVRGLLAARPDQALVKTDSGIEARKPESVAVGDVILVKPGDKVALDGQVVEGTSQVDTSPLTGEPLPVRVRPGDDVMAGSINTASALTVRVTKPFENSSIARVLELVENAAARKAVTEKFITTFARYYTPAVVAAAAGIALVPPLLMGGEAFSTWIYRALVLLVISCPCALVVSIPLGYFGGIGQASRRGILIKGSMFIDALADLSTVVFDKTGTLTRGVFKVEKVVPENGYTPIQVLQMAGAAELHSGHPIGRSILEAMAAQGVGVEASRVKDHVAMPGRGVKAVFEGKTVIVGNDALLHERGIEHGQCVLDGTVAHVVVDDRYAGYIIIGDQLRPDAVQAVERLRSSGVSTVAMLTGDNACTAAGVANALHLDRFHAELLPEDKVRIFEEIIEETGGRGKVAYVGDGINDAPVLARADVGVAMGAFGSDAAVETADVVLMSDAPSKMADAVAIARHTRRIVLQNIALALVVKGVFIGFGAFGLASMWEAVFADMGTALLALLNATRAFRDRPGVLRSSG